MSRILCPFCGSISLAHLRITTVPSGALDRTIDGPSIHHPAMPTLPTDRTRSNTREYLTSPTMGVPVPDDSVRQPSISNLVTGQLERLGPSDHEQQTQGVIANLPLVPAAKSGSTPSGAPCAKERGRTTVPMVTELEVTEPPNLPGYRILGELGRGGMGVVYRAFDEKLSREVALKTLQRISPIGLQRFKKEFRALADIAHPNLVGLHDLLSDGKTWCFTMEILEAVDFLEYVWSGFEKLDAEKPAKPRMEPWRPTPRLSPEALHRLHNGVTQLALGLHGLHQAGLLHRDVKPTNILVTRDGRVVLVDFGLAMEADSSANGIQGTPEYMAPEQAACQPITPAGDWYAVGVMLYELLTGRLPFAGRAFQVIVAKQAKMPPEPRSIEPSVPQDLNDLCMALLDLQPEKRPSVYDVLRTIGAEEIAASLRGDQRIRTSHDVELVGRESHMQVLRAAYNEVQLGTTQSVFVHGKSGMGKSVLIQKFLDEVVRRHDAVVLKGRCYEQESVPFKALDSLVDSLALYLSAFPDHLVKRLVPEDSLPLVRLFPVMGQVPGTIDAGKPAIENVDQQELGQRAMNALREILKRLGAQCSLVLYVDDLQWGDVDSAVLLADLVRPPEAPRLLLLGSYRTENAATSLCLDALSTAYVSGLHHPHRQELPVDALRFEDAARLAQALLQRDDAAGQQWAAKIARESGGWPFFVWELVQHVQDDPNLASQSLGLDEAIWSRVQRLPEETRRFLELIAVAGRPIPVVEAYRAFDAAGKGQTSLAQLRTRNFIRTTESETKHTVVEPYHDRIRESVVAHLDEPLKRRYNLNLAETVLAASGISVDRIWDHLKSNPEYEEPTERIDLERHQWQRVFDLSYFFAAAGEDHRAFPFAVIAAEQARRQNAYEVAEQQYRQALRGGAIPPALRFRMLEGLGDVLVLRGRYDEANQHFLAARELAQENVIIARMDGKIGTSTFKQGSMDLAVVNLEKALRALNAAPPRNFPLLLAGLVKEGITQVLHTYFPAWLVGRKDMNSPQGRMDLFRVRLMDQLTTTYWFCRSMELVLWSHLRQLNLAEKYPPTQQLGKTYAFHAITMSGIPMAERGIRYAEKAYQISVEAGDLWGQGTARSYHTFSCIVLARFKEGVRTGTEAVRLLEQAGDVWESNMARMIGTVPKYHLGDLKGAYRDAKKTYEIGVDTGDFSAVCISLLFWVPNAPHLVPPGVIQTELTRKREDPLTIAGAVYARGLELLLCEDKPAEAAEVLQDCLDRAKKRGLRNVCILSAVTWKATALRIAAEREPAGASRQRLLRAAKKACRDALKITKSYRACRPHALRETGIVAAMEGQEEQARQWFAESLRVAEAYEAKYDHAKTRLAQGEAGLKFGWPNAEAQIELALAEIKEIENVEGD